MPDTSPAQGQPQPDPLQTVAAELSALRDQMARQSALLARQVQQPPPQPTPQAPVRQPTLSDYEAARDRIHAELRENPVRLLGEVTQGAAAQALQAARAEFAEELRRRDAIQAGASFEQGLFSQNPDVQHRWADVRQVMAWAQQNRPDLTPEQQGALSVETVRQRVEQESQMLLQRYEQEKQQRALASSPGGGAFAPGGPQLPGQGMPSFEDYQESLRARIALTTNKQREARRTLGTRAQSAA